MIARVLRMISSAIGATVKKLSVRRAVMELVQDVETARVKQGIIHINGNIDKEDKLLIVDHIHKTMPTAQLRAFQSAKSATDSG